MRLELGRLMCFNFKEIFHLLFSASKTQELFNMQQIFILMETVTFALSKAELQNTWK